MATASPTGQRRETATLRGATPSPASHWPPATPHRERGAPLGAAPLREPHPSLATYRPIGSPLGRRTFAHWPPLGHTLRDGAATWPKGSRPLPLPGLREPHHARPPTGQTGRPTLATLPPFGRPTGAYGHRLPHWPPTGPLLAIRGGLPLAKGEAPTGQRDGRGSLWPHGSSSPPLPGHLWPKGSRTPHWPPTGHKGEAFAPPLTGHPGGPHWPQRDGRGTPSPGPPPDWPPTHPLPTPADSGLRTGGLPTPTYWPPTGLKAPLAIPALPHFPRLFGERWPPAGEGGFRVQRVPIRCGPCALYPLWGPLPPPTGHLPTLTD